MFPFAAEDNLKVRNRIARHLAADTVEAQIGDVVLATAVEAAANLDVQVLNALIELVIFLFQPLAKLGSETSRRRMVPAPGSPSPAASSALCNSMRSLWLTQRRTIFCSTVDRIVSFVKRRAISASARSWFAVMSPSGSVMVTTT